MGPNRSPSPGSIGDIRRRLVLWCERSESGLARVEFSSEGARRRVKTDGLHRAVCDYVALMTDRFCMKEHRRLFGLDLGI